MPCSISPTTKILLNNVALEFPSINLNFSNCCCRTYSARQKK
nr:MAG TPA: hypothetical protein [Caudoviricetes sp.]